MTFEFGKWYPIETAPKDGTRIMAWRELNQKYPRIMAWDTVQNNGGWRSNGLYFNPTHWMPLPPPPIDGEQT